MFPDTDTLALALAEHIEQAVTNAVRERGEAHLVLPGGSSPRPLLMKLRELHLPWRRMHLYLTDERCLPPGHADRNDRMLDELLLPYVDLPSANLHRIPAELGAEAGAQGFAHLLQEVPRFDLVILGLGQDGHTASLFPGRAELLDDSPVVAVFDSPKPPAERVSMGVGRLLSARERIVLAAGAGKRVVLRRIQQGDSYPVTSLRPDAWYLDAEASPLGPRVSPDPSFSR